MLPEIFDDEFLNGYGFIYYPSIYYDNTLSITPTNQRERVWIELHTNDIEEARNWSILTQKNGSANRTLVNERENEKFFEFLWLDEVRPVDELYNSRYGLLSRVHRTEYFVPLFDKFDFFPRFDDFEKNYIIGIYNGEQSIEKVKELVEYLWVHSLLMFDEIIDLNIIEKEGIFEIFIKSKGHDRTGYNNKFVFDTKTRVLTFVERKWIEEIRFAKVDFFEEYGLTLEFVGIWNDYMPMVSMDGKPPKGERASICTIHISSSTSLPFLEISANIITDNKRLNNVPFLELYDNEQFGILYPGRYWKDYRPAIGIRLEDYDRYIMEIIVRIDGKQEVITIGDMVGVTH
jgi:hypothetical protein